MGVGARSDTKKIPDSIRVSEGRELQKGEREKDAMSQKGNEGTKC